MPTSSTPVAVRKFTTLLTASDSKEVPVKVELALLALESGRRQPFLRISGQCFVQMRRAVAIPIALLASRPGPAKKNLFISTKFHFTLVQKQRRMGSAKLTESSAAYL